MTNNSHQGTLLIVDDKPINLKMLFAYLRDLNFKVLVAQDGEDALVRVTHAPPDLILLDVMMPHIDGYETCRRLKENEATRDIPVIFMTALSETVDKVKGFEMGAVDYITKPVQHEDVLARITAHLTIRKLQKDLEDKNQLLEQQNAELEAFAHTVAHDLKNPLNGITGFSSMLIYKLASSLDAESLDFLQHIKKSGLNMADIIDSLLLLASSRQIDVEMTALDMVEIITRVQQRLDYMIKEFQGEIVLSSEWPTALGYAPWIEAVLANYISNGLKYGGRPPRLELGATPNDEGYIRFWVHDNGDGLTPEQQSQLFVPFTRISQVRVEGHGLGLSIVQRVISRCGGQVGVESDAGQGSTFYFTLPAIG